MPLTETAREAERERIARHVLDLVKERGAEVPWSVAMSESGLTRARLRSTTLGTSTNSREAWPGRVLSRSACCW